MEGKKRRSRNLEGEDEELIGSSKKKMVKQERNSSKKANFFDEQELKVIYEKFSGVENNSDVNNEAAESNLPKQVNEIPTLEDLKNGRRIFNNKTELSGYSEFSEHMIEFRQLLYPNLLLTEDLTENLKEKWTMESAIFSTFCYDEEFIEPLISMYKIKTLVIKHQDGSSAQVVEKNDLLTYAHPKVDFTLKWGKFHSKLTILKFPGFIRVIIPSANLTNADWYYWGQVIWFEDFKLKTYNKENRTDFEKYLLKVVDSILPKDYKEQDFYKKMGINLEDYDFKDTCIDLIASTSGRFAGETKTDYGIGRLREITQQYAEKRSSLKSSLNKLIVQCSSLGKALKEKFLDDLAEGFLCRRNKKTNIDIIFPTVDYVNSFPMGPQLSGCLFLGKDTFLLHRYKFRKLELHPHYEKCKTIFHSKFFIGVDEKDEEEGGLSEDTLFYFGSHNLSPSAWGIWEKKYSQVSMANYELGFIFDPTKLTMHEKKRIQKSLLINTRARYYDKEDEAWIIEGW